MAHFPVKKELLESLLGGDQDEEERNGGRTALAPALGLAAYSLLRGGLQEPWRFLTVTPLRLEKNRELD